jgi:small-conductance mechanosensitive channel
MDRWQLESLAEILRHVRAEPLASKALSTLVLVATIVVVHRLLRYAIGRGVTRPETRVKYWNYSRSIWLLLALALVVAVWLEELKTTALVLAGVVAGVLISGKEVFLGVAGRVALAVADHYKIGDRIRINGVCGDVINIGLLYTWLLEVDYDHAENQATGRVVLVPHLWLTQYPVTNSTLGHDYVWDELRLAVPLSVDGQAAVTLLTETASAFLRREVADAARNVARLGQLFAAREPPVTPITYAHLAMESSGHQYLVLTVRYVVKVRSRRVLHSALLLHLLAALRERGIPVYQNFPYYQPAAGPKAPGTGEPEGPVPGAAPSSAEMVPAPDVAPPGAPPRGERGS